MKESIVVDEDGEDGDSECYDADSSDDENGGDLMMRMRMKQDFTSPGFLWVFGTRQRTKWGSQL